MNDDFHRDWDNRLRGIAHNWSHKYSWLDEDEAYSELLVWYAKACINYKASKGSFSTFFYYYQYKAFTALELQWRNDNYMADWDIDSCFDLEDETAEAAIHHMLVELDKIHLSEDAKKLLHFIMTTDLTADKKHKRVGKHTVLDKAYKIMGWSYKRSREAIDTLRVFYGERAVA